MNKRGTRIASRLQPRQKRIVELVYLVAWFFSDFWTFLGLAYSAEIAFTSLIYHEGDFLPLLYLRHKK